MFKFKIHEPTGVLEVYWSYGRSEPYHILVEDTIEKPVKRGVWQYSGKGNTIYFTCPWCGAVGTTELLTGSLVSFHGQSLWCKHPIEDRAKTQGCGRHLTLTFRKKGMEREGF